MGTLSSLSLSLLISPSLNSEIRGEREGEGQERIPWVEFAEYKKN